jgi:hypothetical protein
MSRDTPPEAGVRFVVLVEEVIPIGLDDHHWQLVKTIPVEGDRTIADALARDLAMEHVPEPLRVRPGATAGRSVFRVSDGSWLVEVSTPSSHDPKLARITTAEQVHVQEYLPPPTDDTPLPRKPLAPPRLTVKISQTKTADACRAVLGTDDRHRASPEDATQS